ncbi:MAG: phosphomannomutase/phosphoglucomutase, partial [Candidatus Omnitrophica bacterium]|nr:phosphomannomutase/phosphoglucomutase [Candidatus Omnitrophota bacterium]
TVKLFCEPDGTFPNRHPNPAISKNIRELQKKVVETESDFGVAFDGDGDRAIFVDDRGNIIPADIAIIIYIRNILPNKKDMSVVHDIKCSQIVSDEIRKLGAVPIMEKSGHAFIKKRFLETGAAFAGEVSGHYFFKEIGGDDGLFATLMMAKVIEKNGALFEQIKSIKPYPITPDIRIPVEYPERIIETLINHYPPEMINTLDGVRIQFEHGWALVRKSVTEPVLTMRFEGKTDQELERIKNEIFSLIPELKK